MRSMWVTCARLLASEDGRFTCTRVATATTLSAVSEERLTCRADTVTLERLDFTRKVGRIGAGRLTQKSPGPRARPGPPGRDPGPAREGRPGPRVVVPRH